MLSISSLQNSTSMTRRTHFIRLQDTYLQQKLKDPRYVVKLQEFSGASLILVKLRIYWSFSDCGCDNFTRLLSKRVHCPAFYRRSAITLRLWCGVDCKSIGSGKKSYFITISKHNFGSVLESDKCCEHQFASS